MASSNWQLTDHLARLALGQLAAELDVARPGLGLQHVRLGDDALKSEGLLAVEIAPAAGATLQPPADVYVRGADLIATYTEQPDRRYAPQIYWRGLAAPRADGRPTPPHGSSHQSAQKQAGNWGIELVVSVETSRLDSHPQLATTSRLRCTEALRLVDPNAPRFEPVDASAGGVWASAGGAWLDPASGTGCLLLRLADVAVSYVEMVHPQDFIHSRLSVLRSGELVTLRQQLIHRRLEKGVIVRARVRGWFVERTGDQQAAADHFLRFAASSLPLTV